MRIALGADHAGFELKETLKARLAAQGHQLQDLGVHSPASADYPEPAAAVARAVAGGGAERGLLVCGSGVGMCIAANRFHGVRAVLAPTLDHAELGRRHNDANVLCLGARLTPPDLAAAILDRFLATPFEGGRHERRVQKIETVSADQA